MELFKEINFDDVIIASFNITIVVQEREIGTLYLDP